MRPSFRFLALAALLTVHGSLITETQAQTPKTYTSSEILLGLKKLNVLGSVLYIAAHPDDENTRLIAYMANERLLETGYLSCTRGDGGQNLIGPELREGLGVIRTQELLAARRLDGGQQFFTRANDFGFSKTAEETFKIWDKEQVLADMVWVIRQRRPDVCITRFPPDARAGHGHHTASAMLAIEAFDAAGDPKRFPEQLKYVQAWQPKRLFWNTGSFFVKPGEDMSGYLKLDAGGYNPLLGQSYGEIAARSRSNHRSQGFGSAATRGEALEYFQPLKGEKAQKDPFEGVDMSWKRLGSEGVAIGKLVEGVIRKFDASNPSASVADLLEVRKKMDTWGGLYGTKGRTERPGYGWIQSKQQQVDALIRACLGLHMEATAEAATSAQGESVNIALQFLNRSRVSVSIIRAWTDGIYNEPPSTRICSQSSLSRQSWSCR
ncbi:PIG-L deacetylase family protein [Hymenobacter humi]|uniref:PIG-L deacetylase family protein n=1 Tax=Hymenobacter humi TaxID=1411620 RepID=A0ABW2UAH0_9BACT